MKKLLIFTFLVLIASISKAQIVYKIPYQHIQYQHFKNGALAVDVNGNLYITTAGVQFNPIAGTNMTITGSYPNITFNSTSFNPIAGSNMSITGSYPNLTFTPTIVNLIPGTNITITGTYPNLTINASTSANSFVGVLSGGTGNGSTDDTAAIQASLTAATSGTTVYLKQNSTYLTSSTLTVPAGVIFNLNGSKIDCTASSGAIVQLNGLKAVVTNGEMYSNFAASGTVTPGSGLTGISIQGDSVLIEKIFLHNVSSYGILAGSGNFNCYKILNNRILTTGYVGMFLNNSSAKVEGGFVQNNIIDRSALPASTVQEACLDLRGTATTDFTNGWIVTGNTFIMPVSPTTASAECMEIRYSKGNRITDNRFKYGTIAISNVITSDKDVLSNNTIFGSTTAIELGGSVNCAVVGNTIDSVVTGILIDGTNSSYHTIQGNTIENFTGNGIQALINNSYNEINNNTFNCSTSSQKIISIQGSIGYGVSNNILNGNSEASLGIIIDASNSSGATPGSFVINGNHFFNMTSAAVQVYVPRAVTVDNIIITSNVVTGTVLSTVLSGGGAIGSNVVNTNNVP